MKIFIFNQVYCHQQWLVATLTYRCQHHRSLNYWTISTPHAPTSTNYGMSGSLNWNNAFNSDYSSQTQKRYNKINLVSGKERHKCASGKENLKNPK